MSFLIHAAAVFVGMCLVTFGVLMLAVAFIRNDGETW